MVGTFEKQRYMRLVVVGGGWYLQKTNILEVGGGWYLRKIKILKVGGSWL